VGDRNSTLFWLDPWFDGMSLKDSYRRLYELADNKWTIVENMFTMGWGVNGEAYEAICLGGRVGEGVCGATNFSGFAGLIS